MVQIFQLVPALSVSQKDPIRRLLGMFSAADFLNPSPRVEDSTNSRLSERDSPEGSIQSNISGLKMPLTTSSGVFIELHKCHGRLDGGSIFRSYRWETDALTDIAT